VKRVAWGLVILLLIIVGCGAYLYTTAHVTLEDISLSVAPATEYATQFYDYQQRFENESITGILFQNTLTGTAEEYAFRTYAVTLSNRCLIPAERIELQIIPVEGDVLQLLNEPVPILAAGSSGILGAVLLTNASVHSVREIIITYYLWGYRFTIRHTYG